MESQDQEIRQDLAIYKAAVSARVMATQEASRVEVPKPQGFSGKRDAKELDLIEQGMEKGMKDLREQIQDLCEEMLVS